MFACTSSIRTSAGDTQGRGDPGVARRHADLPAMTEHPLPHDDEDHRGLDRWDVIRIGLVALVAVLMWFHVWQPVSRFDVLAIAGLLIGGWPIWREALE